MRMALKGNESDDEEGSHSDDDVRPYAGKLLLCKGIPVGSKHTVDTIATKKSLI